MSVFEKYKYGHHYRTILVACYLFYTMTMAIKLAYTSQLVEIESFFKTSKALASLGLTIYYFVYALAQVGLGLIISKIDIKKFLVITAILSAVSFSLIGVTNELWQVWIILGLNGIFQCGGWGGVTYILGKNLPNDTLSHCNKILVTGSVVGTAFSYLVSSICIEFLSWKLTFVIIGILYLASTLFLLYQENKIEKIHSRHDELDFDTFIKDHTHDYVIPKGEKVNLVPIMIFIVVLSFLGNCLYYGIGNWIPSYLKEVHLFPTSLSILITLTMPLASVPSRIVMFKSFDKSGKIFPKSTLIGLILTIILVVMVFTYGLNLLFAIIVSLVLKLLVEAYMASFSSYTLMKFKNYINTGTSSLMVNSAASLGAGVIAIVSGLVMDAFGWSNYYLFLSILCAISVAICGIGSIIIKKKSNISTWL